MYWLLIYEGLLLVFIMYDCKMSVFGLLGGNKQAVNFRLYRDVFMQLKKLIKYVNYH